MKLKPAIFFLSFLFSMTLFAGEFETTLPQEDNGKKYGADSVTCVMNLSLYHEFYKQWKNSKYKNNGVIDAQTPWRWVFENCPRASENIYLEGATMVKYRIKKATEDTKQGLIDTLIMVYDRRLEFFPYKHGTIPPKPQKGKVLGRKGTDIYKVDPSAYAMVYETLKESVSIEKEKSKSAVFVYYFRATTKMAQKGKIDTAIIVDVYDELSGYIEHNIKHYHEKANTKKEEEWINIKGNIDNTFEPFAQCNDLVRVYQQKFDLDPNNVELLKKITSILDKKKCVEDPLYFETCVNLHKLEPSPESAYLIGKMLLIQKRYKEAIPYMEEAITMENQDKVDDAYLFLAEIFRSTGNYSRARSMALEAAKINTEDGSPYVIIGDMYAASAKDCGTDDLTKKVAYWAAVDKFNKAKKVDSSLTELMNKRIKSYQAHFPPTEVLFFHALKEGESYTVGCWINEVTKIRAAK
jgi:tetratricopeptide (TPR) repeat protein